MPNSPHAWKSYARALDGLGKASDAQAARTRADTLRAACVGTGLFPGESLVF